MMTDSTESRATKDGASKLLSSSDILEGYRLTQPTPGEERHTTTYLGCPRLCVVF
jgi:hypothetical protein